MSRPSIDIVAVAVGNSRTRFGLFQGGQLQDAASVENTSAPDLAERIAALASGRAVVISSVNDPFADSLAEALDPRLPRPAIRMGRDVPIPIRSTVDEAASVGQDRLLCAIGAYSRAEQACIVIDAGTAVTVDFVDGEGVFHGGAIAPGLNMMLAALHERTAALPRLRYERPQAGPFGKDTRGAMLLGVTSAVRGLVRDLVERYSEYFGAYPQIVATGGDAPVLFDGDELVEHVVPDLQLFGIESACRTVLAAEDADGEP